VRKVEQKVALLVVQTVECSDHSMVVNSAVLKAWSKVDWLAVSWVEWKVGVTVVKLVEYWVAWSVVTTDEQTVVYSDEYSAENSVELMVVLSVVRKADPMVDD
jgi:hypothetical protein